MKTTTVEMTAQKLRLLAESLGPADVVSVSLSPRLLDGYHHALGDHSKRRRALDAR